MKKKTFKELIKQYPAAKRATNATEALDIISKETGWSLATIVSMLVDEEQELVLGNADPNLLKWDRNFWLRPNQIPPDDDSWDTFAFVAGRGSGKTRAGAEWVHHMAIKHPGCRIAIVARTAGDIHTALVGGDSGVLSVGHPDTRPEHITSKRLLRWPNGSIATTFSAEEPDQLRGPQFHYALGDEIAAWRHQVDDSGLNTWDNLQIATRLGDNPQIFVMTTPKRTPFMLDLLEQAKTNDRVKISRGTTMDNAGNLGKAYLDKIVGMYKGTKVAEQELMGNMLEAEEGALWSEDVISDNRKIRRARAGFDYPLGVIAVDPTVAEEPDDECGIVVVGSTNEKDLTKRHAYVLEDATIQGAPKIWAQRVVDIYEKYHFPVIVETNQGGALVKDAIHAIDPDIPILEVKAKVGKKLRAEPVSLVYQQGRVHHTDVFADLETQQISWIPGSTKKSPDRVDALVYAVTALLIKPPTKLGARKMRAKSYAHRKINNKRRGH